MYPSEKGKYELHNEWLERKINGDENIREMSIAAKTNQQNG